MRHGRIPIQDEFTHRTDLTKYQRWQLRNGRKPVQLGRGRARSEAVDLGLALLSIAAKPGQPLPYEDIAAWCGCSEQAITQIARRALRKLRFRLGGEQLETVRALFECERRPAQRPWEMAA
jgi:hypothetical protein